MNDIFKKDNIVTCNKDIIKNKKLLFKRFCDYVVGNDCIYSNGDAISLSEIKDYKNNFYLKYDSGLTNLTTNSIEQFRNIQNKCFETFKLKNSDYGNSFEESLDEEGIVAARVRMRDKWNRFKSLSKKNDIKVKDESIQDTLLDLANYAILTVMWLNKQK